jgi:hypothetical protein
MREPTLLRTFLLLIPPSLLLIACVVAFALERISYGIFADNIPSLNYGRGGRTMTFYGPPFKHATKYEYMEVEIEINVAPTATIIGLTLLGVMVAGVGACGVWELRRVVGTAAHQRAWAWQVCILQVLYAGACVGVLAWVTLVQGEGWKDYRDVEGMGDVQKFTRETWVCQIDQFFPLNDWSASACGVAVSFPEFLYCTWGSL